MPQSSLKSSLKSAIKHNPLYISYIRPLREKLHRFVESRLTDEQYFLRRHKAIFGYTPDFTKPKTFNEKIIHRILYDRSPIYTALADKIKARIYIASTLLPFYEDQLSRASTPNERERENSAELKDSLDSSASSAQAPATTPTTATTTTNPCHLALAPDPSPILALRDCDLLESSSPLFAPTDSLHPLLESTNICPFLPKLYGIYKSFDEIDFSSLPESFAIKTNHDCGGVVLVPSKQEFLADSAAFAAARAKLTKHLKTNFYTLFREYHYKDIEPRIFAEELLGVDSGAGDTLANKSFENSDFHKENALDSGVLSTHFAQDSSPKATSLDSANLPSPARIYKAPDDYKFHCFCEQVFIQVDTERFTNHTRTMFNTHWELAGFAYLYPTPESTPTKPSNLAHMLDIARSLAKPFAYVRVDLYSIGGMILVGEMTFTSEGGTGDFRPNVWDTRLGVLWA